MTDLFDELDNRSTEPSFGDGDYADWWDIDEMDPHLVGVVVELHSEPEDWTEPGEVPETVYTVMSVGRGDFEPGIAMTPKQHKQLKNGLAGAEIGDVVNLEYKGLQKVNGNAMNTYNVGVIKQEEWQELDGADEIEAVLAEYDGIEGDNRRTTPYTAPAPSQTSDSSPDHDVDPEAVDFLENLVNMQEGEMDRDKAEKMLFEVRDFDDSLEDIVEAAGFIATDVVIKR